MSYFLVPPLRRILPGYFEVLGLAGHRFVWTHPSLSEHVQSCLNTSKPACVKLSEICLTLSKHVKHVKTQLILRTKMSGQVWTCLEKFGHVWACLEKFGHVWTCLAMSGLSPVWGSMSYECLGSVQLQEVTGHNNIAQTRWWLVTSH